MSPRWNQNKSLPPDPTQVDQVVDILSALEYGKKKEETELIDVYLAIAHERDVISMIRMPFD